MPYPQSNNNNDGVRALAKPLAAAVMAPSKNGKVSVEVVFQLLQPVPGLPPDAILRERWWLTTDNAISAADKALRTCGHTSGTLALEHIHVGGVVELTIKDEVYEGQARKRVQWVNSPFGGRKASKADIERVMAEMSGALRENAQREADDEPF